MLKLFKSRKVEGEKGSSEKKWVFAKNSHFLTHMSLQADGVNIRYNKLWSKSPSLKHEMFTPSDFKDIGIRKF